VEVDDGGELFIRTKINIDVGNDSTLRWGSSRYCRTKRGAEMSL